MALYQNNPNKLDGTETSFTPEERGGAIYCFCASGIPAPQPRPRAYSLRGSIRIYTPPTAKAWRESVAFAARQACLSPLSGPLRVSIQLFLPRPKAQIAASGDPRPSAPEWPAGKPDIDNLAKSVLDAMLKIAYTDDAQVVSLSVSKRYAGRKQHPGADIVVSQLMAAKK